MAKLIKLTDSDIGAILTAMGPGFAAIDCGQRISLKEAINEKWEMVRNGEEWDNNCLPHKELKRLQRVYNAARELLFAMEHLSFVAGLVPDPYCDDEDEARRRKAQYDETARQVSEEFRAVMRIQARAKAACEEMQRKVRKREKRLSDGRPYFIRRLAEMYWKTFGQPPLATEGGHWETFLRGVLTRCWEKKLSRAHVQQALAER